MKFTAVILFLSGAGALNLSGQTVHFQSSERQASLLELYASEGCSSCPPAEAWLNGLKDSPALWKDFVPVEFHVDYWDYLGWRDRWSAAEFSERQRDFAAEWHAQNIYTPEFVLNGSEWHDWFGLRGAPGTTGENAGVLEIASTNQIRWTVNFRPAVNTNGNFQIHAALLAGGIRSEVKAGENSGRTLAHEFTALELVQAGMTTSNGMVRGKFILAATKHGAEKSLALAVWVTRAEEMTPIQAAGGWLSVAAK